jgi:hypothetical protein
MYVIGLKSLLVYMVHKIRFYLICNKEKKIAIANVHSDLQCILQLLPEENRYSYNAFCLCV